MYKPDERVSYAGMRDPATIVSGPHAYEAGMRWLVRLADGNVSLVREQRLSPLDDRRERVARVIRAGMHGRDNWERSSESSKESYRAVAAAVLAALDEPTKPVPLAVGDRIRILKDRFGGAQVSRGDVLTVTQVDSETFRTPAPARVLSRGYYIFYLSREGTGWERVS
jgi:hypothetical protein